MNKKALSITTKTYIHVEDFDECMDGKFVKEFLMPYFKDVFRDLILRCLCPKAIQEKKLDKVTFI